MATKQLLSKIKECLKKGPNLTIEQKRKLLKGLLALKEGYASRGTTDIANADNFVSETSTGTDSTETNIIAAQFNTEGDPDNYASQNRGIELTPKEIDSIRFFEKSKPSEVGKFHIKYSTTDPYGNTKITIIKKQKGGSGFVWVSISSTKSAYETPDIKDPNKSNSDINGQDITADDKLQITKSIPFKDDTRGADLLSDFLNKINI